MDVTTNTLKMNKKKGYLLSAQNQRMNIHVSGDFMHLGLVTQQRFKLKPSRENTHVGASMKAGGNLLSGWQASI